MAKQSQIPVTSKVSPYPVNQPQSMIDTWSIMVAGFCNGAQAVKDNDGVKSIRIGALVYVEGTLTIEDVITQSLILPVYPRSNGYLIACSADGTLIGLNFMKESKYLDTSVLVAGVYNFKGSYLAVGE